MSKRITSLLLRAISILSFALLLTGCRFNQGVPHGRVASIANEAIAAYEKLLSMVGQGAGLFYSDNLTGRIVWNEQYFMESLLNVYQATREERYLRLFMEHADHVLSQRDDQARRKDHAGKSRPGWQSGAHYTLGVPIIIPDDEGNPSLEVQTIRCAGNNYTALEIRRKDNRFDLIVKNNFRRENAVVVRYENLTLSSVEAKINAHLNPESYIRVKALGSQPPTDGSYLLRETYRIVFHELHTPLIGIPFLRFAALVFENDLRSYEGKAKRYITAFEESYRDYQDSWREDEEGGYFIFEANGKHCAAGLPVPYNGLSANGRFLLWLYRATGKQEYLTKAFKLARKVRAGMKLLPDGTLTMPYWYGLPYQGWEGREEDPVNGLYIESKPYNATEDISHFSLTLLFMVDASYMGLVFRDEELRAATATFLKKIWKPGGALNREKGWGEGVYLAHNLDGKGHAYDYAAAIFALLTPWRASVLEKAFEVYRTRFLNPSKIDGYVLLGWSILALQTEVQK